MPLQSPPRKVSETENMLRLLLCVDALDSVSPAQLWTFAAEQELMDYVSMRLCLHKLLAAGELETGDGALNEQLILTDRGREALSLFGERLPSDVRERVRRATPEFRERVTRNRQVRAVYEMARPNDYRLNLSVCEGDLPSLRIHMETTNRSLASRTIQRFEAHAAETMTYLYGLAETASRNRREANSREPLLPETVTEHSATEFTARVTLVGKKSRFWIELLLPSRQASEALAVSLSQPDAAAAVSARLMELVSGTKRPVKK